MVESRSMVNGASPGPAPAAQARASSSAAHPVQLTDVAPPEAAQEGAQGGWRLDRAAQGAGRPPGAQHIGVVNAVAAGHALRPPGHHLVSRVGPPRILHRPGQGWSTSSRRPRCRGEGGRQEQTGIGHQAVIVIRRSTDTVGVVAW